MRKLILIIFSIWFTLSCGKKDQNKVPPFMNTPPPTSKNIRFDFKAINKPGFHTVYKSFEVTGTLFNDNPDTAYFLTTTCDGPQYSLRFDTAQFESDPQVLCVASWPMVKKIPPNGKYDFQAFMKSKTPATKIILGFDFYEVDSSFNVDSFDIESLNWALIHNRKNPNIVWAQEHPIEESISNSQ